MRLETEVSDEIRSNLFLVIPGTQFETKYENLKLKNGSINNSTETSFSIKPPKQKQENHYFNNLYEQVYKPIESADENKRQIKIFHYQQRPNFSEQLLMIFQKLGLSKQVIFRAFELIEDVILSVEGKGFRELTLPGSQKHKKEGNESANGLFKHWLSEFALPCSISACELETNQNQNWSYRLTQTCRRFELEPNRIIERRVMLDLKLGISDSKKNLSNYIKKIVKNLQLPFINENKFIDLCERTLLHQYILKGDFVQGVSFHGLVLGTVSVLIGSFFGLAKNGDNHINTDSGFKNDEKQIRKQIRKMIGEKNEIIDGIRKQLETNVTEIYGDDRENYKWLRFSMKLGVDLQELKFDDFR